MPDLLLALVVVSALSLATKSAQWVGLLGVFVLCVLYTKTATALFLIAGAAYLFLKFRSKS
jgi:hypothetical protein